MIEPYYSYDFIGEYSEDGEMYQGEKLCYEDVAKKGISIVICPMLRDICHVLEISTYSVAHFHNYCDADLRMEYQYEEPRELSDWKNVLLYLTQRSLPRIACGGFHCAITENHEELICTVTAKIELLEEQAAFMHGALTDRLSHISSLNLDVVELIVKKLRE